MTHYTIGIDTGGTYTDAVIVDTTAHKVIATAKALTTKTDLSVGITEALDKVLATVDDKFDRSRVSMVCLSTTLATNALIEGHGASVGVLLIGFKDAMVTRSEVETVSGTQVFRINGGHQYNGEPRAALDTEAIEAIVSGELFDSYAITARWATRNPDHERKAQAQLQDLTGRPVSTSVDLSASMNDPARALTTTLNARITSLINALQDAVTASLQRQEIDARLMVVKGDGSIADLESVRQKPIETILSGPAASVIGAKFLTNSRDFVVADIGGTTSDVAMIKNGWPTLNDRGAQIGGFHTLVQAIDMHTVGLGGDSEVLVAANGKLSLSTQKIIPVALLANKWPWVESELKDALNHRHALSRASHYLLRADEAMVEHNTADLSDRDRVFLAQLASDEPRHYHDVVMSASDRGCLARLSRQGRVLSSGITPSDAAHVLGQQSQWSTSAATLACALLGRSLAQIVGQPIGSRRGKAGTNSDEDADTTLAVDVATEIHQRVVADSTHLIIQHLTGKTLDRDHPFLRAVLHDGGQLAHLQVGLNPSVDVVAVGGPAAVFYPEVGKRLGVEVQIPAGSEVANAIGAAVSLIRTRTVVEITHQAIGEYLLHPPDSPPVRVEGGKQALQQAEALARQQAAQAAATMGGGAPKITVATQRINLPGIKGENRLMAATIVAEVVSGVGQD